MVKIQSWGRLEAAEHTVLPIHTREQALSVIPNSPSAIAHGMGRSYGDVCLNPHGTLWSTSQLDRLLNFDQTTGRLTCESGVLLKDIQTLMIPRGWMLPVTPGTQLITVGGAIANDIHGKNHHKMGSFGDHIVTLSLLRTDGQLIQCGPDHQLDWFAATIGGVGLTGFILSAQIQLRPVKGPWLNTESIPFQSIDRFFDLANASEQDWEHTVAWIDCMSGGEGRGIFMRANHSEDHSECKNIKRSLSMPIVPPISLVNRLSLPLFNTAYYHLNRWKAGPSRQHYEPFFYPLDNIQHWNRMYGPAGFYQYQSIVPFHEAQSVTQEMLTTIKQSGEGSFLAVLKTFGERHGKGLLSFPRPGVSLALDFPNKGTRTVKLFEKLDSIVAQAGGRIYLAKDARMSRELFESGYPNHSAFQTFRDPGISSALSRRLMGK
jgi:FAD/FMN-containing dehydrogenase